MDNWISVFTLSGIFVLATGQDAESVSNINPNRDDKSTGVDNYWGKEDPDKFLFEWSKWSSLKEHGSVTRTKLAKTPGCENCFTEHRESKRALVNHALRRKATASSQYMWYSADLAVDGNTATNFQNSSCMHTKLDASPWLRIDLGDVHSVYEVIVYNRGDCCTSRANNLTITVGNNPDGTSNAVCGFRLKWDNGMFDVTVAKFLCPRILTGRYVHFRIPGPQYLHLCEVEVLGLEEKVEKAHNLALEGDISACASDFDESPSMLIDGSYDSTWYSKADDLWIKLQLKRDALISEVHLVGEDRTGCIEGSEVLLVDENDKTIRKCGGEVSWDIETDTPDLSWLYNVRCREYLLQTQAVKIVKHHRYKYFCIAEVEVIGFYLQ